MGVKVTERVVVEGVEVVEGAKVTVREERERECEAEIAEAGVVGWVKVSVRGVGMSEAEPQAVIQQDDVLNVSDVEGEGLSLTLSLCLEAGSEGFFFWALAFLAARSSSGRVWMSTEANEAGGCASEMGVTRS